MRRALDLARKGQGRTAPNPMVGAVITHQGQVIGEGYHRQAGKPHAEIEALRQAGSRARGGRMVLNLEPCCHQGRTPPCTDAIIKSGIREVVVGLRDPNPKVRGKGIRALKQHGIKVLTGVMKAECEILNEVFLKYITTARPFVILKSAISLDGKIATDAGNSRWITGPEARQKVHQLRHQVGAILVGAGTVLKDDPQLTTRLKNGTGNHPVRVILDNEGLIPYTARVFKNASRQPVIYVTSRQAPASRIQRLQRMAVEVWVLPEKDGGVHFPKLMQKLAERELTSVMIEGGGRVNASALKSKVVDKIILFMAPILIGGTRSPNVVQGAGIRHLQDAFKIKKLRVEPIGTDWVIEGYLKSDP